MLRIIAATDKGLVRELNEDRFAGEIFDPDCAYALVCDGMGGENAGSVASGIACEEIRRLMESSLRRGMDEKSLYHLLEIAVSTANAMVYDKALQDPENMGGMGTTACLAVISGETAYIANVGDSRAYLLRGGELSRLTVDHTVVQLMLDNGEITPEQAEDHQDRHYLTRAVGVEKGVDPAYSRTPLQSGDMLLLCSDGLYNMIPHGELAALIRKAAAEDSGAVFPEAANAAGGRDNITAVLIIFEGGD